MDIYETLMKGKISEEQETCGMDAFLSSDKIKVASLDDLFGFMRIGEDTLVHKAKKDLWSIKETGGGKVVIERLFDPSTKEPLKI